jgi:aryl-alcohol dehydrogenase-like predicted oxidoreductase
LREAASHAEALKSFLSEDKPTLATLALKFCLSNPAVCTTIPGMRNKEHVEANCRASDGILIRAEELEALRMHAFAHGWSYPGGAGVSKE